MPALSEELRFSERVLRAFSARCLWNEPLPGTQVSTRIKGRVQCRDAFARSGLTPGANRRIGRSRAPRRVRVAESKNRHVSLSPDETFHFPGFRIRTHRCNARERERKRREKERLVTFTPKAERTGRRPLARRAIAYFAWCVLVYRLMDVEEYPDEVCEEQTNDYDEGDVRVRKIYYVGPRASDESVRDVDSLRG